MERQVPMQASQQKRQQAEDKSKSETDEVEICPCHCDRLRSPTGLWFRAAGGFRISGLSASSKRSARPGVSRIAPSRRKHRRVSFSRAAFKRTSLTSGSLANRSDPWSSHTSSLPSIVRRSEVSSV